MRLKQLSLSFIGKAEVALNTEKLARQIEENCGTERVEEESLLVRTEHGGWKAERS